MSQVRCVHGPEAALEEWPIPREQIREGSPRASGTSLHEGADGAGTGVWEVTEGSFDWEYATHQSLCVLSGRAQVAIEGGPSLELGPGDAAFFPAGTRARWTVRAKLRKVYSTYR
jgi:uncharacterized cupin superfamily protein